ncbi:MAG: inovirus-type Gp2 protein [Cellvibrio sp.]
MVSPHYHLLLFNGNTCTSLGDYCTDSQHLYEMISRAWAAAPGSEDMFYGKDVHVPDRPTYFLNQRSAAFGGEWGALMTRISYFAKADTKYYWGRTRSIGYSA